MDDPSSVNVDTSVFIIEPFISLLSQEAILSIKDLSELDESEDSFSDVDIDALLNTAIENTEDLEVVKDYLREQLNLATNAPLTNIPTDLIMDLLDLDADNDADHINLEKIKVVTS